MVAAVQLELDGLAAAAERPGLVAVALALARVLDDPAATPHVASVGARLVELLDKLHKRASRRGKLAAVRALSDQAGQP